MKLLKGLLLAFVFGLSFLQAWGHRLSYRTDDSYNGLWFLVFLVSLILIFLSPVVCIILGFFSRRSKPIYFFIPFVITLLIGIYLVVMNLSSFWEGDERLDGFFVGIVYLLIGIGSYVRRRIGTIKPSTPN